MVEKIPYYTPIHKGQRRWLFDFAKQMGRSDFSSRGDVEALLQGLGYFYDHIKEHAEFEERFIHPRLGEVVPGCPRAIESEHKAIHADLEDLLRSLERLRNMPEGHPTLPQLGQEVYLATNRFVAFYLRHIDYEEDHVQNILLNACTADELLATFRSILAAQSPKQLSSNLRMMIQGINDPEALELLSSAKGMLPPQAFEGVRAEAEKAMNPERWSRLAARL
ncbi:MAG: hemerythrin domain-containing protein [Methanomassiliicoccales archaeon]|nr:hemerythrin domain-containing protein [Methanomassiliicoccales archaeon]